MIYLTPAQIRALRSLSKDGTQPHPATAAKLKEYGLVGRTEDGGTFLSPQGLRWVQDHGWVR